MSLNITTTTKGPSVFIVSMAGSLDLETYEQLKEEVDKILCVSPKGIIFDFKEVDYITSLGLSVIFETKKKIEEAGGTLAVAELKLRIKKVFDAVKFFPSRIFKNMEEANEYFDTLIMN